MANVRYRAVIRPAGPDGVITHPLVSHPIKRGFVGYERAEHVAKADYAIPGGHAYRRLPDGEVLPDSVTLRNAARDGAIELLPLELPKKTKESANG
jgi:hypothetical protein